jgi:DNA-binding response OmpR family regulator
LRILLVEDEPQLAAQLVPRLEAEGFVVDHCASLGEAFEAVIGAAYRAVLLDRRLPDGDGLSLLAALKTRPAPPPVIVLTAMGDVAERVAGLDAGAEDYLAKPFAFDELLARLRVRLRRDYQAGAAPAPVRLGRLDYDLATREAEVGGVPLELRRRELALLDALVRRAGRVVAREQLDAAIFGYGDEVGPNALETHASRLRRRLAEAGAGVELHAIRGIGYLLKPAP